MTVLPEPAKVQAAYRALAGVRQALIGTLHRRIFGGHVSAEMQAFLGHLSISVVGQGAQSVLLFIATILAGRLLGPVHFGTYSLTVALSQVCIIPMLLGLDVATMRQVALAHGALSVKRRAISSGFFVVVVAIVAIVTLVLVLPASVAQHWGVSRPVALLAVCLAASVALKTFLDGVIRGEQDFIFQAKARIADAVTTIATFMALYWLFPTQRSYALFIVALLAGGSVATAYYYLGRVHRFIRWRDFNASEARYLWRYIRFGLIGAVGGILLASGDKLLINWRLGSYYLGVYAAYYFTSTQLGNQLSAIFINVFFPSASSYPDKLLLLRKFNRLVVVIILPALALVVSVMIGSLWLFSRQYPVDGWLVIAMSLAAVLQFIWQIYAWLVSSWGAWGVRYSSVNGVVAGAIYLAVASVLLPHVALYALPLAYYVSFAYLVAIWLWRREKVVRLLQHETSRQNSSR